MDKKAFKENKNLEEFRNLLSQNFYIKVGIFQASFSIDSRYRQRHSTWILHENLRF